MTRNDFYQNSTPDDAENCLMQIASMARIGAAASDSCLYIDVQSDMPALFELIHMIAKEALDLMGEDNKPAQAIAAE